VWRALLLRLSLSLLGTLACLPFVASAQQAPKLPRLGWLGSGTPTFPPYEGFRQGLRELGYVEGKNIAIEVRWAGADSDRLPALARELVGLNVDLLFVSGDQGLKAAKEASATIPIVVAACDPLDSLVVSIARPGGKATGLTCISSELAGKRLQLLQGVPSVKQVRVMFNPRTSPYNAFFMNSIAAAAPSFDVLASQASVHNEDDIQKVISTGEADGALIVPSDPFTHDHATLIASLATNNRLPGICAFARFAQNGGLIAYGIDLDEQLPKAADYVARILKGEKVGDLPIQAPTRFRMTINLKSAKTLGLQVPDKLLALADEVIE
jgi:putative tryptophan/tyrosine transport system substrate-binding protein